MKANYFKIFSSLQVLKTLLINSKSSSLIANLKAFVYSDKFIAILKPTFNVDSISD